ncbi:DNA polymerase I [Candidatus Falkowbacteria bacterium RIFOXYB2_FULL_38_15]|uniref:DNA polymerase I n=1 Tax=Candidatus Falkowbacteria bacterium RIFOXYA2_FULL_38_12 TaxID=1797993 RepID=A0A1F5S419_9BACT|nr:MAG: DNA polymerase I [Candidatus Falkowbacteria bacterium RIFOXYA2_FULL_38_12]OGF32208.1 MAG: DNA polymerase I [Candidatus Falkowbacteria bacterium RIFOXYB2_FULL_38_15]OGF44583.1 MAG: DNA polymerase I [Candidatus Falkowbacteria bacterium RIFOXYD2_FULL_39_16]
MISTQDKNEYNDFLKKLAKERAFVFNINSSFSDEKIVGISFCLNGAETFYLPIDKKSLAKLKPIFENRKIEKWGHDLKQSIKLLAQNGINVQSITFDTAIASYLLNPGARNYNLETLASTKLQKDFPLPEKNASSEDLLEYSRQSAMIIWQLKEALLPELEEVNLLKLFKEIELPLLPVLAEIENNGVKINSAILNNASKKVTIILDELAKKIYKMAGEEFNLDSPIQLRKILFEKLGIKTQGLSKGKTGVSTSAGDLQKLKKAHPIAGEMLQYRELAKLNSTYLEALPKLIDKKTGRIHADFNQIVTSTGRLSSSNPNLQNIPTKGEFGKVIREAFIAPAGTKILAADYAHIELRIIASLADDEEMIRAFKNGEDIHSQTASKIWGIDLKDVTPEIRRAAKTINFGVTYGMGAKGLAESAEISITEAREFIQKYFEVYEGVSNFLRETREKAYDLGYVETIFGRKRYLPEIFSPIPMVKAEAERMAINMPIQGTAADIIKMAMIKIHRDLPKVSPRSKIILQVHDELVFEVPEKDLEKVAKLVKDTMEKIIKLKVPIIAEIKVGNSWGELKKQLKV